MTPEVTAFEVITKIMNDKKFEMMYPYLDICKLREALVVVHENKEYIDCTEDQYKDYTNACKLFGVKPHELKEAS